MANAIAIRRRIRSVKNTKQITKAMELVSASKMRRAQDAALASREYAKLANQILTRLRELTDVSGHPLFKQRQITKRLYVVVTSDRGLAGAYNSNVLRAFAAELKADEQAKVTSSAILIGKQAARFAGRINQLNIIGAYDHINENPGADDVAPIITTMKDLFVGKKVDAVDLIYTNYVSSLTQTVTHQRLLPAAFTVTPISNDLESAIFEPSPEIVLEQVTERLIEVQLLQGLFESQASEQSARMMAMKTASDNATELIDDLTLAANTARQAAITQELAEITGGAEAMK